MSSPEIWKAIEMMELNPKILKYNKTAFNIVRQIMFL